MNIELPAFVIAEMFAESLVIIDEGVKDTGAKKEKAKQQTGTPALNTEKKKYYLGNNEKHVSILVYDEANIFLDDECLQLLTNMITACKLNMADIAIINTAKTKIDYQQVKNELNPLVFLFFGVESKTISVPFAIPHYQVQNYAYAKFMFAPSLPSLLKDDGNEKKKLWTSLKKIFEV